MCLEPVRERQDRPHGGQARAPALLGGLVGDLLPALFLGHRLFRIIAHDAVAARQRLDGDGAELDRLLHDEFELVALRQALREHERERRLRIGRKALDKAHRHRVRRKARELHARDLTRVVDEHDLVARLRAHRVEQMMRVIARERNHRREQPLEEQASHTLPPARITSAAQPASSITCSMASPCAAAAASTSARRSSMMPEASSRPPGAR